MTDQPDRPPMAAAAQLRARGILLVTRNLPPLIGGMERLNLQLAREMIAAGPVTVIGPSGSRAFLPGEVRVVEVARRPLPHFFLAAGRAAWREARRRPAIVVAGSGATAPIAVIASWRARARSVAYVHGLDLVTRHPAYQLFWMPFLRRLDHAWANSASTADIATRAGVARRSISVLHPGVSMPHPSTAHGVDFRAVHGLESAKVLLSVGRLTPRKGLPEFVRQALPGILRRHSDAVLLVIGDDASDAIAAGGKGMAHAIRLAAASVGVDHAVRLLPHCSDEVLSAAYGAADLHVFPVVQTKGDIEGFGMVALEAAAHGLPTVAFATGGVPDAVSHGISGWLVSPGDYAGFSKTVCRVLDAGEAGELRDDARQFARGCGWRRFGSQLRESLSLIAGDANRSPQTAGHAVLDLRSRSRKAVKIERVLGVLAPDRSLKMLEIGTGSGGIAHYFGTHPSNAFKVESVDVRDARQLSTGYRFRLVDGVDLPFEDGRFDLVISNHVIEHVGDEAAQLRHLAEVRRVMASGGRGYLAVPNRWMLVEPHYGLPFLSWLPRRLRSTYLRMRRGVAHYDCEPLTTGAAEALMGRAGLGFTRAVGQGLKLTVELEHLGPRWLRALIARLPDRMIDAVAAIVPTLIYRIHAARPAGMRTEGDT